MFHKPFKVKTQTAIKGSDRKKLRSEIGKQFSSLFGDDLNQLVPNKDEMTVMKICCHSGQNILVYNIQGNPAFFQVDTKIYPTVYTLWKRPDLMYTYATWPPVLKKIVGGADLMLPGLIVNGDAVPKNLGNLPRYHPCAVKLFPNRCPVAVGYTALSSEEMYESAMRGKGVNIIHCYQDHLWMYGDKSEPPIIEDTVMIDAMKRKELKDDDEDYVTDSDTNEENMDDEPNSDKEEISEDLQEKEENGDLSFSVEDMKLNSDEQTEDSDQRPQQEIMDELLYECFRVAVKVKLKKSDLPILTSTFYSKYLLTSCPRNQYVDIKKSSYKKLSKFLRSMKERGFIKIKDQKGVESITEVQKDHADLRGVTLLEEESDVPLEGATAGAVQYKAPEVSEIFLVNGQTQDFFKPLGLSKGKAVTSQELRNLLTDYVKTNELKTERGFVTLDGPLSDLLCSRGEYTEHLKWDELFHRCQSNMGPAYQIKFPSQPAVLKKGKPSPVVLNIAQRAGNKKVTMVENLETYGIDPEEFGHSVQIGVACSTSLSQLPGKGRGQQLMIQGNQINYVADLLINKYKLKLKWINGLDKAPKGKKR